MIPIFKPYMPEHLEELEAILHSGSLAYGKWGKDFERSIANYIGVNEILVVNSYNSAVLILLSTLGIEAGSEVIASPMACLASNQPFPAKGIRVVWCDIDPNTGTLDPEALEKKITSKTKAIFHNHHCGYPGYIDEVNSIGKKFGIPVVDDCIEAFGSVYKDRMMGSTGSDATVFSFQTVRLPNTIDGGAVVFKDKNLSAKAKLVRDLGVDRTRFRDERGEISPLCDITTAGYGALLSEVNAYIGFRQMSELSALLSIQRGNAEIWIQYFTENFKDITILHHRNDVLPNFWIFSILTEKKEQLLNDFRNMGYYASGVHLNNNLYSVFGFQGDFPGVTEFATHHLALPCGWWFKNQIIMN